MNTREGHNTGLGSRHPRWCQENTQPTGQNPPIPQAEVDPLTARACGPPYRCSGTPPGDPPQKAQLPSEVGTRLGATPRAPRGQAVCATS